MYVTGRKVVVPHEAPERRSVATSKEQAEMVFISAAKDNHRNNAVCVCVLRADYLPPSFASRRRGTGSGLGGLRDGGEAMRHVQRKPRAVRGTYFSVFTAYTYRSALGAFVASCSP